MRWGLLFIAVLMTVFIVDELALSTFEEGRLKIGSGYTNSNSTRGSPPTEPRIFTRAALEVRTAAINYATSISSEMLLSLVGYSNASSQGSSALAPLLDSGRGITSPSASSARGSVHARARDLGPSHLQHLQVSITSIIVPGDDDEKKRQRQLRLQEVTRVIKLVVQYKSIPSVETVSLQIVTNDVAAIKALIFEGGLLPPSISLSITDCGRMTGNKKRDHYKSRIYIEKWQALAANSNMTAFVYLEDDIELSPAALQTWDREERAFLRVGIDKACFQVIIPRYTIDANGYPHVGDSQAPMCPAKWPPCKPERGSFCAAHPFIVIYDADADGDGIYRVYVLTPIPYNAMTIISRPRFELWLKIPNFSRGRWRGYLVRETSACGMQWLDENPACPEIIANWTSRAARFPTRVVVPVLLQKSPLSYSINIDDGAARHGGDKTAYPNVSRVELASGATKGRILPLRLCPGMATD